MLKKRYLIMAVLLGFVIVIGVQSIPHVRQSIVNGFWEFVATQLDREAAIRQEQTAHGELVRGNDTVLIWNEKYEIWRNGETLYLSSFSGNVLSDVKAYKKRHGKLYVVAEYGFAVIDNQCRAVGADPENKDVVYLQKFEMFSPEEQELLLELRERNHL